ncbi:MAG: efflux RND transporter permease subunit [Bacteroidales bacterium]|nr:efflux RND transporter permease subunit [Bacteroidales bacterium]
MLLVTAALSLVGLFCASRLKMQYSPAVQEKSVTVSFSMAGASAIVVENEVTSRIEGVLSGLRSRSRIASVSRDGGGQVTVTFDKYADIAAVRMEVASAIRNLYPSLPGGVSYPSISLNSSGTRRRLALSFSVRGDRSPKEISSYISDYMLIPLSSIPGINRVGTYGGTEYAWKIIYDAEQLRAASISPSAVGSAVSAALRSDAVGIRTVDGDRYPVSLSVRGSQRLEDVPVARKEGRVVHLRDVAAVRYEQLPPSSFYRINGLNTITVNCYVEDDVNMLSVCSQLRSSLQSLEASFPQWLSASVEQDSSVYLRDELNKIYLRTLLCILILLVFVALSYRSWKIMLSVTLTIMANLLVAVCSYAVLDIGMHIYTLAGITVSIGIIIDTSIMMMDHYSRHADRSVFPSLVCAVLTTVAAVSVVFLLPDKEKANLTDFCAVIAVNLTVSLLVAYFFVPALSECIHPPVRSPRPLRWDAGYKRYILWGQRHRWLLLLVVVLSFGLPTCLIPSKPKDNQKLWKAVVSWEPYGDNKHKVDAWLGTSFALFHDALNRGNFYREPERTSLMISAGMPEGCTVVQLDGIMRQMENYLSQFDFIETYSTNVYSFDDGQIQVFFKPEAEKGPQPALLKADVISAAMNFGGATWSVYGVNDSFFNNNVMSSTKSSGITLSGYNYERLISYAEILIERMSENRRVSEPEIWGSGWRVSPKEEYRVSYDPYLMALGDITPTRYFRALQGQLYDEDVAYMNYGGERTRIILQSSAKDDYDLWNMRNVALRLDSTEVKLSGIGEVTKSLTGLPIRRVNQSYEVNVRYDFIGSYQLSSEAMKEYVAYMNDEVLPVGFHAQGQGGGWSDGEKKRYASLIALVLAIIFVICSAAFESLRRSLCVLLMIPFSFVGTFLVFGLSEMTFDKGGFAAFIMLGGLVVNAAIYLIYAHDRVRHTSPSDSAVDDYIRVFDVKVRPIALTLLSTVLGLLPFLSDGPEEVFWFDFAAGTISGLVFSFVAIVFLLPVFLLRRREG